MAFDAHRLKIARARRQGTLGISRRDAEGRPCLPLPRGFVTLVDEADLAALEDLCCWSVSGKGYVSGRIDGRRIALHRHLLDEPDMCSDCGSTEHVDVHHINEDKLDNRRANLEALCRVCHRGRHPRVNIAA